MVNALSIFSELSSLIGSNVFSATYTQILTNGVLHFEQKRKVRFDEFYKSLLNGKATKEEREYEDMFKKTEEQYFSLLNLAIEDDEREKAPIYANVYRSILEEKIPPSQYKRLIRLAKELPYNTIEILAKIYIYKSYQTKNKTLNYYINELKRDYGYELNILTQNNIINGPSGLTYDIDINKNFFNQIIKSFFKDEDLLPKKYNICVYSLKTMIISDLTSNLSKEITFLENLLDSVNIKIVGNYSYAINKNELNKIMVANNINEIVVLIDSSNILNNIEIIDNIIKSKKKIIKVCFNEALSDPIPEYGDNLIYLDINKMENCSDLLSKFDLNPMAEFMAN